MANDMTYFHSMISFILLTGQFSSASLKLNEYSFTSVSFLDAINLKYQDSAQKQACNSSSLL